MKVVIDVLGPLSADSGGRTFVRGLARELTNNDHRLQVTWLCSAGEESLLLDAGARNVIALRSPHHVLAREFQLPGAVSRLKPDVVLHALNFAPHRQLRVPQALLIHSTLYWHFPAELSLGRRIFRESATRWSVRAARQVACVSRDSASRLRDVLELGALPSVIYNGVDHAVFFPDDRPAAPALPDPSVLFVSSLWPYKGIDTVLRAIARLRDRGTRYHLLIAGSGLHSVPTEAVRRQITAFGLTDLVTLLGDVPADQLRLLYSNATCFVQPSRYESFGLSAAEAMACGAVTIVSSAYALPEVVADGGFVFSVDDDEALACAMAAAAAGALEHLRSAGRRRAAFFSWSATADGIRQLLDETVEGKVRQS